MFALWALLSEVKQQYLGGDVNEDTPPLDKHVKNEEQHYRTKLKIKPKPQPLTITSDEIYAQNYDPVERHLNECLKEQDFDLCNEISKPRHLKFKSEATPHCTQVKPKITRQYRSRRDHLTKQAIPNKQISELKFNITSPDYQSFQQSFDFRNQHLQRVRRADSESVSSGIGLSSFAASETSSISDYPFSDDEEEYFSNIPDGLTSASIISSRRSSFASCVEINLKSVERKEDESVKINSLSHRSSPAQSKNKVKSEIYTVVKPDVVHCAVTSVTKTQIPELVLEKPDV